MPKAGVVEAKLSQEELDKTACWIGLLVPYCGDYRESNAWSPRERAGYEARVKKREASEAEEQANIRAYTKYLQNGQ